MPAPIKEAILTSEETRFRFSVEPVPSALYSLLLLTRSDELPGLHPWIQQVIDELDEETRMQNLLVIWGLHYTLTPDRSWNSFPAYLDHLENSDPEFIRDKLIKAYLNMRCMEDKKELSIEEILESEEGYLDFLRCRFDEEIIYEDIERKAYRLLKQPEKMLQVIVQHLRKMWDGYLKDEWDRTLPLLEECVGAFEQVDLSGMTDEEALRFVTGQESGKWADWPLDKINRLVFVPSTHVGPHMGAMHSDDDDTFWIIFGARQPQGVQTGISDLSRTELLVWLSALSDDTRLRILGLLGERGELCAQEMIDLLDLSQSTCSRHLRQLTATGYLTERRQESGKCYKLNPERFEDTARAITSYVA
jgi:DNA-binding transcriptional ArsR family regulator